jgi:hypothetical protein
MFFRLHFQPVALSVAHSHEEGFLTAHGRDKANLAVQKPFQVLSNSTT